MGSFPKPVVVISRCLGFERCRYNGDVLSSPAVEELRPFIHVITPCPEVSIGLGVPRDPIRLVDVDGDIRLQQPSSSRDVSDSMKEFSATFLDSLDAVDGFILKSRSPSCGPKEVRIYASSDKSAMVLGKTSGYFAGVVMKSYPSIPLEDEGRLKNFTLREKFLIGIFTLAAFRATKALQSMATLVQFHARNKYLFMAFSPYILKKMGQIVGNHQKHPVVIVLDEYELQLRELLKGSPSPGSFVNVLLHEFGYMSKKITASERAFFLETIEDYRNNKIPLSSCARLLQSLVVRFGEEYLSQQTIFHPYPRELVSITDSGKGRDF